MPHAGGCGKFLPLSPHRGAEACRDPLNAKLKPLFHFIQSFRRPERRACVSTAAQQQISLLPDQRECCSWGELHASAYTGRAGGNSHLLHITKTYYKQTQMVGITKGGSVQWDVEHKVEPICTDFLSDTLCEGEI